MSRIVLQNIVEDINFDNLPDTWRSYDLKSFSKAKELYDFQIEAVKNAIKALHLYYQDTEDYQDGKDLNSIGKEKLFALYENNGLDEDFNLRLDKRSKKIFNLLSEYYPAEDGKVHFKNFINRMSFWMATGSGKTLVIVKLLEVLKKLIENKEVPAYDILILTHRDDLLEQLKRHINDFSSYEKGIVINLRELKEYESVKREHPSLFKNNEFTVFYYRSDNISDEQKEKIIDFKNYDNDGKWYIFLDEAHKGDKEDSKRQILYSILSRNGFLFNFSATFTDPRDVVTTAYNFNLAEYVRAGYGKHICVLKQEIRAFRGEEDYNEFEKQKIVLKSLVLLTYVKTFYEKIKETKDNLYHNPLLLTLVNSVNTQDADLELFFRELEKIGRGEVNKEIFEQAKAELLKEFSEQPELVFENERFKIDEELFGKITIEDVLRRVYNSESPGNTEVLTIPSNRQELIFKLKTSDSPFALIKIGDISNWLKEKLEGYEVSERFENESYFRRINQDDSDVNILMGSRSFYEGWDSNRPNVINFINIGTGTDARKFILQSVGRGVRIQPVENKRKRLLKLYNSKEVGNDLFESVKDYIHPIETLFIFGTNRKALDEVIRTMEQEKGKEGESPIELRRTEIDKTRILLIPTYKLANRRLEGMVSQMKFPINENVFETLRSYINYIDDDRIFLMLYNADAEIIKTLKASIEDENNYYNFDQEASPASIVNIDLLVRKVINHFNVIPEEFERFKLLDDERIVHFRKIRVSLKSQEESQEFNSKVKSVMEYKERQLELPFLLKEIQEKYGKEPEKFAEELRKLTAEISPEETFRDLRIKYIAQHYYVPLILSEEEKLDYIKHIIKTKSEVRFIKELEKYIREENNDFKRFDWWMFSKIDEHLDDVYIPYYDPNTNNIRQFKPDFVFWLQKDRNYFIVFIDPKGVAYSSYQYKVDSYKRLFEENGMVKVFKHNGCDVRVFLFLNTDDVNRVGEGYRKYWFDGIDKVLDKIRCWR